jgi:hypothetical protein
MNSDGSTSAPAKKPAKSSSIASALPVVAFIYVLTSFMVRHYEWMPVYLRFIFVVLIALGAGWVLVMGLFAIGFGKVIGQIVHVQVTSPGFIAYVGKHYERQALQFQLCGFDTLFYFGEAIPLLRIFLVLPAIVLIQMWVKGVPMTLYKGTRILNANPVFGARDRSAYAHPNSIGVTFHIAFRDGTILLTRDHVDDSPYPPKLVVRSATGSLSEVWAAHQRNIGAIATDMNPVDRQSSFEFYSVMVRKEVPTDM